MRFLPYIALGALLALPCGTLAQGEVQTPAFAVQPDKAPAGPQATLEELLWVARPLVVFADTPTDPRFVQQMQMLRERPREFKDRDVVILTDTDPGAEGPLREALHPRGFGLVLIDKDGIVAQRRPAPTTARELINLIDRMPSRRQETGSARP